MKNMQKTQEIPATVPAVIDGAVEIAEQESKMAPTEVPQVHFIPMGSIIDSPYNPRQHFDQEELEELAESIKSMGVLMPILVRPKGDQYERIYGERRYRAAILAELTHIPAYVKELSDKQAEELALAENLFRVDLTPLELAEVLEKYTKKGYSIRDIVNTFGLREHQVRLSIKLNDLIPEMKGLLKGNSVSLGIVRDLSQYPEHIQRDVFNAHFSDECTGSSWRQIPVEKFRKAMKDRYTSDLNVYSFDKAKCDKCPFNTKCSSLFPEEGDCGSCTKPNCLKDRNKDFLMEQVTTLSFQIKNSVIAYDEVADPAVSEELSNMGYEIRPVSYYAEELMLSPGDAPAEPSKEDYEDETDFLEAKGNHEVQMEEHAEVWDRFNKDLEDGTLTTVLVIRAFDILLMYIYTPQEEDAVIETDMSPTVETSQVGEEQKEKVQTVKDINEPLLRDLSQRLKNLQQKTKRNGELALSKKVEKAKEFLSGKNIKTPELHPKEENIFYSFFIDDVRKVNFTMFGLKKSDDYIDDTQKEKILSKLTPKRKTIIIRDHILSQIWNKSAYSNLALDMAKLHFPEDLSLIEKEVDKSYAKSNDNIAQEMAKIEKEITILEKENKLFEKEQKLLETSENATDIQSDNTQSNEVPLLAEQTVVIDPVDNLEEGIIASAPTLEEVSTPAVEESSTEQPKEPQEVNSAEGKKSKMRKKAA